MKFFYSENAEAFAKQVTTVVVYHRVDSDGRLCAAIAFKLFGNGAYYLGLNYENISADDLLQAFPRAKLFYTLDYCFPPEVILDLIKARIHIRVCDHHEAALKAAAKALHECSEEERARCLLVYEHDAGWSGCQITWMYFFNGIPMPPAIELIGIYDTWKKDSPLWSEASAFNRALSLCNERVHVSYLGLKLLAETKDNQPLTQELLKKGFIAEEVASIQAAKDVAGWGGTLEWEGITFLCLNGMGNSDMLETAAVKGLHQAGLFFRWSPSRSAWKVSLRGLDNSPEGLNLVAIAQKYDGGGHKLACGFVCNELPFDLRKIEALPKKMEK